MDWKEFFDTLPAWDGEAGCVIAGDKAAELTTYLCPFAEEQIIGLFNVGESSIITLTVNALHKLYPQARQKWIMTIEIEAIDTAYKAIDIKQLYAQVLKRKKQNSHDSRI